MSILLQDSPSPAQTCFVSLCEGEVSPGVSKIYQLKLGESIRIEADYIQRYCFSDGSALQEDVAAVLSAVRMADRAYPRLHSRGWPRSLSLEVPVYDLKLWESKEVSDALGDVLKYLTGDDWRVKFKAREGQPSRPSQLHLAKLPEQKRFFIPYSSGLDSFALASKIKQENSSSERILITVQASSKLKNWRKLGRPGKQDFNVVQVASYFKEPHRTEPTFRSRPLIYGLLACLGAAIAQPAKVLIPENGQGSLGGSLVPLGDEAPHRSCHPGFTSRLSRLVEALTGESVRIEHPALFQTKGQVLADLASSNPDSSHWLAGHRSCSYDARHCSIEKRRMHCGVCGNCLLRRVALHWAQIEDSTGYEATNLAAASFEDSFAGAPPRTVAAKRDVALNSIRTMQRLADLADSLQSNRVVKEVANLSRALSEPIERVRQKMEQLLQQHKAEWTHFVEACGPSSWVANVARNSDGH